MTETLRRLSGAVTRGLVLGLLGLWGAPALALQNQLEGHASPYLAMHAGDPVAWQDWDPAILERAQSEGRMIFISSGYFSCHWCHVMQRESYRDPEIAALLNAHFIPVKLDRELNPALDAHLVDYLERTRGHAGWPLNLFLTPEGYPLVGATYLPAKRFLAVISRLNAAWEGEPDRLRDLARKTLLELSIAPPRTEDAGVAIGLLRRRFASQAMALADPLEGGFGQQNKFPMAPQLLALLRLRQDHPDRELDHLLILTLDQMAGQGLRDQLGGGFFRYTVDPSWEEPHFEKMLYTQAQLARVYLLAGRLYRRPDYLEVARDTLDFVLREMRGEHGMFIAAFSAVDGAGEEGAYYLWDEQTLVSLLGEADAGIAGRHWLMWGPPTLGGGHLPRQGETVDRITLSTGEDASTVQQRLQDIRTRLLQVRARRDLPADTKELAGWNGLLLGALALAGGQLDDPVYREEADRLARRIRNRLWHDGSLWRARAGERPLGRASLADYAYVAEGLGLLLELQPDPGLQEWRDRLVADAWRRFHDRRGWRSSEAPPLPGMAAALAVRDGALPAAPAVLIEVSLQLADPAFVQRARDALRRATPELASEPFWYPSYLSMPHGISGQ